MMQIASIPQIKLLAMLALAPRRTLHRQTQEFELPPIQAPRPKPNKIRATAEENGTTSEQNEEKFLFEPLKENPAFPYPVFKPVSLPDY